MSQSTTSFTYGSNTVTMEVNPVLSRDFDESQEITSGYNSDGVCYAYDIGCPIFRNETVSFPAVSSANILSLMGFVESTIFGSYQTFTWNDMGTIRTARYKSMSWQQVSRAYYRIDLTLEVLL